MSQKVSIPKGTRDFGPLVMQKRDFIFETIRQVFRLFGYQPLETPSMENLNTLLGKYGDEGDKLLFRILNSGDFLSSVPDGFFSTQTDHKKMASYITEKGLRYDLTVPFARYVVMNRNEIQFPFKRFQIQPVWRADRPQKGRYREFYQCDADVIGSESMLNEFELVLMIDEVFNKLNLNVTLHINNRKVLDGILQSLQIENLLKPVAVAIDKLEKSGSESVLNDLISAGIASDKALQLLELISFSEAPDIVIEKIKPVVSGISTGESGILELTELNDLMKISGLRSKVVFDLSLARGLDYYTGAIFEVKADNVKIGSICGGGRYDNLTGFFGMPGLSGVGISFGADRIYDVMSELQLFPAEIQSNVKVLFLNFGKELSGYIVPLLMRLRNNGISAEFYPDHDKIKKQMNYANKKNIPFIVIAGEDEIRNNSCSLKNMTTGEQSLMNADSIVHFLNDNSIKME
jgi:histidyl-tRNA synthetase